MINHHYDPRTCNAPMPRISKIDCMILVLWIFFGMEQDDFSIIGIGLLTYLEAKVETWYYHAKLETIIVFFCNTFVIQHQETFMFWMKFHQGLLYVMKVFFCWKGNMENNDLPLHVHFDIYEPWAFIYCKWI
jgi:hypothetical protein